MIALDGYWEVLWFPRKYEAQVIINFKKLDSPHLKAKGHSSLET